MVLNKGNQRVKRHRGIALLLTCASLLIITSQVLIAAHQTAFLEVYRVANELKSRQEFWLLNGGLECALAHLNMSPKGSMTNLAFDHCSDRGLTLRVLSNQQGYQITGEVDGGNRMRLDSYLVDIDSTEYWVRGGWRDF